MKTYWTAIYGIGRKSQITFQGSNAKRNAKRIVARYGGKIAKEVAP
jgi:hypothetical protein